MTFGVICLAAGVVLTLVGNAKSARRVKRAHGDVNPYSVKLSEGTGVVPKWLSLVVLLGYVAIVVRVIALTAGAIT